MMKRRNVESSSKYRTRPFHFRKYKFGDGMYAGGSGGCGASGSAYYYYTNSTTFLYIKFLVVWLLIMVADFMLEFRFEFLWPFWLFIRSLHDSFKYQGIIFSIFFALISFLSDLFCYMFLPVQWLFFAASTYVWVQYVWHTEKGVCLPTVSLWLLFVYIEASFRLKSSKTIDLCRPFAAHCIGYPMVTLGFGFKSYLGFKYRLRKQKEIRKKNKFYLQLVAKALPEELQLNAINYDDEEEEVTTKETEQLVCDEAQSTTATSSSSPPTAISTLPTTATSKSGTENKPKSAGSGTGFLAAALSYCLNGNSISSNNSSSQSSSSEELPYIQQKEPNKSSGQFNNSQQIKPATSYKGYNMNNGSNFKNSNKSSNNTTSSNNGGNNNNNSNNSSLPSFSISSLGLDPTTTGIDLNMDNDGNLLVVSSGKNTGHHHHHRSASSSNSTSSSTSSSAPNSKFITTQASGHTNININMTINATAIAAATASATTASQQANSATPPTGTDLVLAASNTSKKAKNKENKSGGAASSSSRSKLAQLKSADLCTGDDKDEIIKKLDENLKKLHVEIDQQKTIEQYLRNQLNYITKCDQADKLKIEKLEQENESLQSKLNKMSSQKSKEKEDLGQAEKRLQEEKKMRMNLEKQLSEEKKARELLLQQQSSQHATNGNTTKYSKLNESTKVNGNHEASSSCASDSMCVRKLREMELENKRLEDECTRNKEKIVSLEGEMKLMAKYKEAELKADNLKMKLNLMQDKNASLQESLSAETRFKLDLFSALGEARRQLECVQLQLDAKENELIMLKSILKHALTAQATSSTLNAISASNTPSPPPLPLTDPSPKPSSSPHHLASSPSQHQIELINQHLAQQLSLLQNANSLSPTSQSNNTFDFGDTSATTGFD